MEAKLIRKVLIVGKSYMIVIPREVAETFNLKKGDLVYVTISKVEKNGKEDKDKKENKKNQ